MKRLIIIIIMCDFFTMAYSQKMNLNDCMEYAVEKNHEIRKQVFQNANYREDKIEAIASMTPAFAANSNLSASYGRSIDPETNTYTNTGNLGNSYSISGQVPLFAGFQNINNVRIAKTMSLMGVEQLQKIKDEVCINTMRSYFDVVFYTNSSLIAKEQLSTSLITLEQTQKMFDLGLKSAADVAQIESQVASDELFLTQQENNRDIATLSLKQQMNYPIEFDIEIETDLSGGISELMGEYMASDTTLVLGNILEYALANNSTILASEYSLRGEQLKLYVAQGKYAPSIYGNGGWSTNYYKMLNGASDNYNPKPFFDQLKDNRGYYFGASISIPIFNGLARRTNVHRAKNNLKIAQQNNDRTQMLFKSEVAQTVLEMKGYEKEYSQASKKVEASDLSHQASLSKYQQGLLNPIELQTTANQLLLAKSQQLNAHLQYIIRRKLVEYYNGIPLVKE